MMPEMRDSIGFQSCTTDAHIGQNALKPLNRRSSRCSASSRAVDVDVNEALALAADIARTLEVDQPAGDVALDDEDRMNEQADIEAALIELADHGIDQKRHVVVDDFKHRGAASCRQTART